MNFRPQKSQRELEIERDKVKGAIQVRRARHVRPVQDEQEY